MSNLQAIECSDLINGVSGNYYANRASRESRREKAMRRDRLNQHPCLPYFGLGTTGFRNDVPTAHTTTPYPAGSPCLQ